MAVTKKKTAVKTKAIRIQAGSQTLTLQLVPAEKVAAANARIQKELQPVFEKIKRARKASAIAASKIILNA